MKLAYTQPAPFVEGKHEPVENKLRETLKNAAREGTEVDILWLRAGYSQPTCTWTKLYNAVEGVKLCYRAWKMGYDGIVIGCSLDPGLIEARSIVDIPVAAAIESSVAIAATLGNKFSIICIHKGISPLIGDNVRRYGFADKVASIRSAELTPAEIGELYTNPAKVMSKFYELASQAVREDKAEVIIPGCSIVSAILAQQKVHEVDGVPIVDSIWAGIKMAEVLVDLKRTYGIGVCRKSIYSAPPDWEKEIPIEP